MPDLICWLVPIVTFQSQEAVNGRSRPHHAAAHPDRFYGAAATLDRCVDGPGRDAEKFGQLFRRIGGAHDSSDRQSNNAPSRTAWCHLGIDPDSHRRTVEGQAPTA